MYSKQEASLLRQQFWTSFGGYMSPVLSAEGEKINWVNYKTGVKGLRFTMETDNRSARVSVLFSQADPGLQKRYFDKFMELKDIFRKFTGEGWEWEGAVTNGQGKTISGIHHSLYGVNVFNKSDWPAIISFLKPSMMALDAFWCEYKIAFDPALFNAT
jgi:hypothetical protein